VAPPGATKCAFCKVDKSPAQIACEKSKGTWAGHDGSFFCSHLTRDGGKSCRKASDCEGYCLARSRTCAPVRPLLGCVPVLTANGTQAEICLD